MNQNLSGWGNNFSAMSQLISLKNQERLVEVSNHRGVVPRGLGKSYGDSAINSGGVTLDSSNLKRIAIDIEKGVAVVGGGVSIFELECEVLKFGFFPAIVPGTSWVTVGGAIASDIHGKSHHKVGSFSSFLLEIKLLTCSGEVISLKPEGNGSHLFWATVGGMGLTGMILEATLSLIRVESAFVSVTEKRVKDLDELVYTLIDFNKDYLYTVAWVDLSGDFRGRGVVSGANHTQVNELSKRRLKDRYAPQRKLNLKIPIPLKINLISGMFIRVFNSLWFHKPLSSKIQPIQRYMHPLDLLKNWNAVYGPRGFVQYQFVIPLERTDVLKVVLEKLRNNRSGSFLSVLKSFGEESRGLLSFPMPGWTLAIDFPNNALKISGLLRELDELVINAGGRIYLTKDSRLSHLRLSQMFPNLQVWKQIKKEIDPQNFWQSDQGRRLKLC